MTWIYNKSSAIARWLYNCKANRDFGVELIANYPFKHLSKELETANERLDAIRLMLQRRADKFSCAD